MDKLMMIPKKPLKNLREIEQDKKEINPFASYKPQNPALEKYLKKTPSVVSGGSFSDFVSDFSKGFKQGFEGVMSAAKPFLPLLMGLGYEKRKMRAGRKMKADTQMKGCGKSLKPTDILEMKAEAMAEPMKGGKHRRDKRVVEVMAEVKPMAGGKRGRKKKLNIDDFIVKKEEVKEVKMEKKPKRKASAAILERAKKIKEIMEKEGKSMIDASKALAERNKKK